MNKKTLLGLIVSCVVVGWMLAPVLAGKGPCACAVAVASASELTDAEAADLQFMREEEKLARDVYNAMYELYGQRVFSNIPRAEQHHMDAILGLINAYGLEDSIKKKPGKFRNTELQKLYNDLVARGAKSREEAYLVGALIEEVDIKDLEDAMRRTGKEDLLAVFDNLIGGSKRHLNAFVRNYEAVSGKTYVAQKMPQVEIDAILGR
ncbi:DUF2202 domain-containing protein [Pontiella sulfatireligans]|uniref:DUF2202 domain-containing protein n=1 Tax=Pontiella sulfatireligans TaxID=2750658 RepID=A0A6C2UQP2_9BACT|nr:DUF2202 domain-containing protein [Pontiella sulfatireligans]VGO22610.1 hypothetical protein SCARR_04695 [Pontiella sulfatireligans]